MARKRTLGTSDGIVLEKNFTAQEEVDRDAEEALRPPPPPTDEERIDAAFPQTDVARVIFETFFEMANMILELQDIVNCTAQVPINRAQLKTNLKKKLPQIKGYIMGIFDSKKTQTVDIGPWGPQQPYIKKGFSEADRLYDLGGPQFFPDNILADRNPLINQSEDALMGYAGGNEFANMMDKSYASTNGNLGGGYFGYNDIFNDPNVGGAYNQLLSGDPNPYTADAARAVRGDMMEDYSAIGGTASKIRNAQVSSGQYGGGTRGDLMNRRGQDELDENMRNTTAQMYNQNYNLAQDRMGQGLGLAEQARRGMGGEDLNRYSTAMRYVPQQYGMEMDALGVPGNVGLARQAYDQSAIDAERERWDYNQNLPYSNLANRSEERRVGKECRSRWSPYH